MGVCSKNATMQTLSRADFWLVLRSEHISSQRGVAGGVVLVRCDMGDVR